MVAPNLGQLFGPCHPRRSFSGVYESSREVYSFTMSMTDHLPAAIAEVQQRLDSIAPEQWSLPSTCEGWDVRELARHLVGGAQMSTMLMQGSTKQDVEAMFASDILTTDPAADFAAAAGFELRQYRAAATLDTVVPHPAMPMP